MVDALEHAPSRGVVIRSPERADSIGSEPPKIGGRPGSERCQLSSSGPGEPRIVHECPSVLNSLHVIFDYDDTGEVVEWRPFTKALPTGTAPLPLTSAKPVSRSVFDGYKKSLFPVMAFDSAQERDFARVAEQDKAVASFIRLPINQFPVRLRTGNYNPDFLVFLTDGTRMVVEIKERPKIEDKNSDVAEKARAAEIWCAAATRLGHGKWIYRLYAHDSIAHATAVASIPPAKFTNSAGVEIARGSTKKD